MKTAELFKILILTLATFAGVQVHAMDLAVGENEDGDGYSFLIADGAMTNRNEAAKIRGYLTRQATKGHATAIFLTSPGGFAELMPDFAKAILLPSHELFKKHGLFNIVVINEECSSACAILSAHLTNRREPKALRMYVAAGAQFGLHSPVELVNGQFQAYADPIERENRISQQLKSLLDAGVDSAWLDKNIAMFREARMTMNAAKELCASGSRIIPPQACVSDRPDLAAAAREDILLGIAIRQGKVSLAPPPLNSLSAQPAAPVEDATSNTISIPTTQGAPMSNHAKSVDQTVIESPSPAQIKLITKKPAPKPIKKPGARSAELSPGPLVITPFAPGSNN